MKKKLTGNQVKLILCLISLGIFAFAYFNVYMRFTQLTTGLTVETKLAREQIQQREQEISEEEIVKTNLMERKAEKDAIINEFPSYIAKEDNYMFVEQMEDSLDIDISSISLSDNTVFYTTILPIVGEENQVAVSTEQAAKDGVEDAANATEDNAAMQETNPAVEDTADSLEGPVATKTEGTEEEPINTMAGLQNSISITFQTTYEGFKELVNYINHYPDKTVINNTAVTYDNATGFLTGSMVITRFALSGTGKTYEAPYIDDISIGTDNIFGTSKAVQNGGSDETLETPVE
jgi:hypothetical protein